MMETRRCTALLLLLGTLVVTCYWILTDYDTTIMLYDQTSHRTVKRIVTWTTFFGKQAFSGSFGGKDQVRLNCSHPCTLHAGHGDPLSYDALLFHARDNQHRPKYRRPDQVYVIYVMESPAHQGPYISGDYYNWTATYNPRSDFWLPYLRFRKKAKPGFPPKFIPTSLPQMTYWRAPGEAMVAWVVSNCHTVAEREKYILNLQCYIKVDIFGKCGKQCYKDQKLNGGDCHKKLAETGIYKFYLSFENSACQAYITEKVHHPLSTGLVPIVYGGLSHEDYVQLLPPHSFIDVREFSTPATLAKYLFYLDGNNTAYLEYHAWRRDYEFGGRADFLCAVCDRLFNSTVMQPRSVNWGQYWGIDKQCEKDMLGKVNGSFKDESSVFSFL